MNFVELDNFHYIPGKDQLQISHSYLVNSP